MKDKAGWFCMTMAAASIAMGFVEHIIFKDVYGVVICFTSVNIYGAASIILLKLDEITRRLQ